MILFNFHLEYKDVKDDDLNEFNYRKEDPETTLATQFRNMVEMIGNDIDVDVELKSKIYNDAYNEHELD